MRFALIALSLLFSACVSQSYRSPGEYHGGPLLGRGTYLQDVSVETANGQTMRFQGIFQRRATGVMITGLSPLGTTVFRVKDPLTPGGVPAVEIFVKEMEPHRERFEAFYRGLRPLLTLDDKPALPSEVVRERWPDRRPKLLSASPELSLYVDEYDWEGHAFKLSLIAPHWKAKISLREYTQAD